MRRPAAHSGSRSQRNVVQEPQARGRRAKPGAPGHTWAHVGPGRSRQDGGRPHSYGDGKVPIEPQASDDGSS